MPRAAARWMSDAPLDKTRVVAVLPLRRGRELRASVVTYGEEQRIALRVFYQQPPDSPTWVAASGLTLPAEAVEPLEQAVTALRRAIDATPDEPNAEPEKGG